MRKAEELRRHRAGHNDIADQIDAVIAVDCALAEQAILMSAVLVILNAMI